MASLCFFKAFESSFSEAVDVVSARDRVETPTTELSEVSVSYDARWRHADQAGGSDFNVTPRETRVFTAQTCSNRGKTT